MSSLLKKEEAPGFRGHVDSVDIHRDRLDKKSRQETRPPPPCPHPGLMDIQTTDRTSRECPIPLDGEFKTDRTTDRTPRACPLPIEGEFRHQSPPPPSPHERDSFLERLESISQRLEAIRAEYVEHFCTESPPPSPIPPPPSQISQKPAISASSKEGSEHSGSYPVSIQGSQGEDESQVSRSESPDSRHGSLEGSSGSESGSLSPPSGQTSEEESNSSEGEISDSRSATPASIEGSGEERAD